MTHAAASSPALPAPSLAPLQSLVKADVMRMNEIMVESLDAGVPLIRQLSSHIIAAGGKRLRPSLTLASAKLFDYTGERHIHLAACVEFIHTATLLHDDVVDESTLRRGEATANSLFGNQASVLVGDYLLSRAFQLMTADGSLKVLRILSNASAVIARGEVKQLEVSGNPQASEEDYLDVIGSKTAALFAAACELGPVICEQEQHEAALRDYGYNLGIAFQMIDDALDYSASQEKLGKNIGDDFREGKITLPVILAYREGSEDERRFWHRTLEDNDRQENDLAYCQTLMERYGTINATIERARMYATKAIDCLQALPEVISKQALTEAALFCVSREY